MTAHPVSSEAPTAGTSPVEPEIAEPRDRLADVIAVGLAIVGLLGALVAWRVVDLGGASGDATRNALSAARDRSGAILAAESTVAQTHAAWIEYEVNRRLAAGLRDANLPAQALRGDKAAAAHWGFVEAEYLAPDGTYLPDDHRDGIVAREGTNTDLDPAPHLADANAAEMRALNLSALGVLIGAALPLLTVAEVTRGRIRLLAAAAGAVALGLSTVAVVLAW